MQQSDQTLVTKMVERSLKDKVVVVTGGAVGIGLEIARNYLQGGAKVVVLIDINEKSAIKAVAELTSTYGTGKAVFIKADITSEKDLEAVFDKVIKDYEYVDVLVNNAGVLDETNWKRCVDINVTYLIGWSLKYRSHMRKDRGGKGGTIVNVASIYGYRVDPYIPVYQASKYAVMGFTRSLGHSYNYERTKVRVVAICPTYTDTELTRSGFSRAWDDQKLQTDFKNFLDTEAVWQKVDVVGKAAADVFKKADSGTAWLVEGNETASLIEYK